LALLRQAVLEKAAYVEIELDVANDVRRYGPTQRVVAYTNLREVPANLESIYADACAADPDVVKLTLPARTPEETLPIVKLIAKGKTPTVAVGLGRNALMLNILGRRYKAPWTYAALEKGMEPYPGMATIGDLQEIYDFASIDSRTPLLAVGGAPEQQALTARVLNHAFRLAGNKTRCLPFEMGDVEHFKRFADAVKLAGVLVDPKRRREIVEVAAECEDVVRLGGAADFIGIVRDQWKAFDCVSRAIVRELEEKLTPRGPSTLPLEGRTFVVVGATGSGLAVAASLLQKKALVVLCDRDNDAARSAAAKLSARYVPCGQIYSTICDGLILFPNDENTGPVIDLPRSVVREGMAVVDLSASPRSTQLLEEARFVRGIPVSPVDVLLRSLRTIVKAVAGQSIAMEQLREPIQDLDLETVPTVN
jgi:3-dehydroquinate dehydratase/shikimate dehydrogenase